jgi:hypothetical protein
MPAAAYIKIHPTSNKRGGKRNPTQRKISTQRETILHAKKRLPNTKKLLLNLEKEATNRAFLSRGRPRGEVDLVCAVRSTRAPQANKLAGDRRDHAGRFHQG